MIPFHPLAGGRDGWAVWANQADDGLDIPDNLKRDAKAGAA
jgi:hypothetical protein